MLQRYITLLFLAATLLYGLSACQRSVDHDDLSPPVQDFLKTGEGTFRGLEFDDSMLNIENRESAELVEKDDGYLLYILQRENYSAEIGYYFDGEDKLNMIKATISFKDESTLPAFKEDLTKYYNSKYVGGANADENTRMWEYKATSGEKGTVEVVMKTAGARISLDFIKYYEY